MFKDRAKTALTTTDLEPAFKKIKGQKLLLMMDVAYKGFDAGKEKVLEPTISDFLKLAFDDADRDDNALPSNRVLVFGNLPFRDPLTKGDHGLFYSVLADGLAGKADEKPYFTGYESDGLVTINELAKYLEKEIPNGAREVGKTDKEKELIPFVIGTGTSRLLGDAERRRDREGRRAARRRSKRWRRPASSRRTMRRKAPRCCSACRS